MSVPDPRQPLPLSLGASSQKFLPQQGQRLDDRVAPFEAWLSAREQDRLWPYGRICHTPPADHVSISSGINIEPKKCINFGSQDYLGLARHPEVLHQAIRMIETFGVHSAGSPTLAGRTCAMQELESLIADRLHQQEAILFATGWAAGFGALSGFIRSTDTIAIDRLAHNCLIEGARHATSQIAVVRHNDLESLDQSLFAARVKNPHNGLFVVFESLYSMDSDSPDLREWMRIIKKHGAVGVMDIAHDFGAMGEQGLGILESCPVGEWPDIILGSFSKTFASNGGFVCGSRTAMRYLRSYASPLVFSNAPSPVQVAVIRQAMDIAFSNEGDQLRAKLLANILRLRRAMESHGLTVHGTPSPIVPVSLGNEPLARLTSRYMQEIGLAANLVEFPAVPRNAARFRFQVMSSHTFEAIDQAAVMTADCRRRAEEAWPE